MDADGREWQAFYLRWLPAHNFYGRMRVALAKSHSPEICLQAGGLTLQSELSPALIQARPDLALTFRRYLFRSEGKNLYVFFAVVEDESGTKPAFMRMTHFDRLRAALSGSRNFGQRNLEIAVSGFNSADEALKKFQMELPGWIQTAD
jgi:hypothetical protein